MGLIKYSWPPNDHGQLPHVVESGFPTNGHPMFTGPFDQPPYDLPAPRLSVINMSWWNPWISIGISTRSTSLPLTFVSPGESQSKPGTTMVNPEPI